VGLLDGFGVRLGPGVFGEPAAPAVLPHPEAVMIPRPRDAGQADTDDDQERRQARAEARRQAAGLHRVLLNAWVDEWADLPLDRGPVSRGSAQLPLLVVAYVLASLIAAVPAAMLGWLRPGPTISAGGRAAIQAGHRADCRPVSISADEYARAERRRPFRGETLFNHCPVGLSANRSSPANHQRSRPKRSWRSVDAIAGTPFSITEPFSS
jgi:hypothetical protein